MNKNFVPRKRNKKYKKRKKKQELKAKNCV